MDIFGVGREGLAEIRGKFQEIDVPVKFINTQEEAEKLILSLPADGAAMDTETVYRTDIPLNPRTAELRVISIAIPGKPVNSLVETPVDTAYVIDVRDLDNKKLAQAFKKRADELGVPELRVVGFNADFDDAVTTLNLTGWNPKQGKAYRPLLSWKDLQFAYALIYMGTGQGKFTKLSTVVKQYLGYDMDGKGTTQLSYDAKSDLTQDQIDYAGYDALLTLWAADAVQDIMSGKNLNEVFTLECNARPFLQSMTIQGLAFDQEKWMGYIDEVVKPSMAKALEQLADATDGGQMTLGLAGTGGVTPNWNPDSSPDVKRVLNEYCPDIVAEYIRSGAAGRTGEKKLNKDDTADKGAIKLMLQIAEDKESGAVTLLQALLTYSNTSKILSTYGDSMMNILEDDGRFHSIFTQCQTATGRTSSRLPNAQNFSPLMKKFFTPAPRVDEHGISHKRVLLHADYSQAEIRVAAQLTGEPIRRKAFQNKQDQHEAVAAAMWDLDMEILKNGDETMKSRYKRFRGLAKSVTFGLQYGMGAEKLARSLTVSGQKTTKEEAGKLIEDYYSALPVEQRYLEQRDQQVKEIASEIKDGAELYPGFDFALTRKIAAGKAWGKALASAVSDNVSNDKSRDDLLHEILREELGSAAEKALPVAKEAIELSEKYFTPVVVFADGRPFEFTSTTVAGRLRHYQVTWDMLEDRLATRIAMTKNIAIQQQIDIWSEEYGLYLADNPHEEDEISRDRHAYSWARLQKIWKGKNKPLRRLFVKRMLSVMSKMPYKGKTQRVRDLAEFAQREAMAQIVQSYSRQYRNAPIQGTVADAALLAFGNLQKDLLSKFDTAFPVTTVHDSIVVEVDIEDAEEAGALMKNIMEDALARYIPNVAVVADMDILQSLHGDDYALA